MMSARSPLLSRLLATAAVVGLLISWWGAGCSSDEQTAEFPLVDASSREQDSAEQPTPTPEEVAVPIALDDYLEAGSSGARARLYQVESDDQLAEGPVVEARVGDWVMENDRVRLFLQGLDRAMSPCPWGGNIIDAQYKGPAGELSEDVTGESCLMINVSQTLAPERFDVVRDGSDGGAVVLAVSGELQLIDFLNISTMAADYAPGILDDLGLDTDTIVDAKLTRYLILHPGDNFVRVVTALRNDEDKPVHLVTGHMMRGGAHGHYFNPLSYLRGWGYRSLGIDNLEGDPLSFIAYSGPEGGYAYVPKPDPRLRPSPQALERGGVQVAVSGVAVSLLGRDNFLQTLMANESQLESLEGLLHLQPGEVGLIEHYQVFGDGKTSTMVDEIYGLLDIHTGTLQGRVTDHAGEPVEGTLVTAIDDDDRGMNRTRTDAQGRYSMRVPVGYYDVRARTEVGSAQSPRRLAVSAGETLGADVQLDEPARIDVGIETPDGEPTPGRISIWCEGDCPDRTTSQEEDISLDPLPSGVARIVSTGVDGRASIRLPPGSYRVAVSRGMEWSIWPHYAAQNGGHLVELDAGEAVDIQAEIARVVDSSGAISADFHVHGVTSPDSVVRQSNRVLDFMGEGVDVLISTDHDFISDYAPVIDELGAADEITSMVGVEITTPAFGHFNAFPLERDPSHRRGGALDWGGGYGYDMTPAEIFAWADSHDGDPDNDHVTQINHPRTTIPPLKADMLRGISLADRGPKRVEPAEPDPDTGDTGMWSEDFTAIEMMNGQRLDRVWTIMRWWLTMVSRGFSPTATAVTDTHRLYSDLGGSPRTFVFVGDDYDTSATFDEQVFARATNDNRAVGTNGPFFRVELQNSDQQTASLGEVLESSDGQVTARVDIQSPEWIRVDRVDIYTNLDADDIVTHPGQAVSDPIPPSSSHPIDWQNDDLVEVARRNQSHRVYQKHVEIPVEVTEDAYVVVVLRGSEQSMWPVIPNRDVRPFAFSNPVFVDADGGGYDNPPFAELAQEPMETLVLQEVFDEPFEGELTPQILGEMIEEIVGHDH
jgi:hypothetical protein